MTMQGMITFEYAGSHVVFDPAAKMWNLTEMHQAAGSEPSKAPRYWLRQEQARGLIETLAARSNVMQDHIWDDENGLVQTRWGNNGGTWAHWQIAAAYAHYLRPDFYLQWNEWAMERAQQIATGDGAAPLARVAALEARVAALEGPRRAIGVAPRPERPKTPYRVRLGQLPKCPTRIRAVVVLDALTALGGAASLTELREALPGLGDNALRGLLQRMVACGLVARPHDGRYQLL